MNRRRLEVGEPVDRALWFVESHFAQPIGLDEIAEAGRLSRSEMSRAFRRETGIALSAYLRGRRLTEAAKALAAGARSVTAVALACGYGSHEAFGRAFRAEFGITPAELRERASLDGLALTAPVRGAADRGAPILSYRFLRGAGLRIAGVKERLPPNGYPGIPAIWQRFHAEIGALGVKERVEAFGVVSIASSGEGFEYLAGIEVGEAEDIPRGLAAIRIPAQRYAVFPHRGHVAELAATAVGVIAGWLLQSGLTAAAGPPDFVERYAADFDPWTGQGGIEIWVPIAER